MAIDISILEHLIYYLGMYQHTIKYRSFIVCIQLLGLRAQKRTKPGFFLYSETFKIDMFMLRIIHIKVYLA